MIGAYMAVGFASQTSPKALWSTNPVTITFSESTGIGHVDEFVKCAPKQDNIVFRTTVSNPAKISLTTSPGGEATCGPAPDAVTVTAHCLVAMCRGTYTGTVSILQGYTTIPPNLSVTIRVT